MSKLKKRQIKNKVHNPHLGCDSTPLGVLFVGLVCPRGVDKEETGALDSVDGLPLSDTLSSPSLFFEPAHHDLILPILYYILLLCTSKAASKWHTVNRI
jgi:hypothetical protein